MDLLCANPISYITNLCASPSTTLVAHATIRLRSLPRSLEVVQSEYNSIDDHVRLHINSMSIINYSNNFNFHRRSKHMEIKYHFMGNEKEEVQANYVPTWLMVANPMTLGMFKIHVRVTDLSR